MKSQKVDVLMLSSWYPNLKDRLDGNFVQNQVKASALYDNIKVLYATSYPIQNTYEYELLEHPQYSEHYVYFKYHPCRVVRFWRKIRAYQLGLKKIGHFDLIHANIFFNIGVLALLISIIYQKKLILTEHSSQFLHLSFIDKLILRVCLPFYSKIIPISHFLKDEFAKLNISQRKLQVVPLVVDTKHFALKKQKVSAFKVRFLHVSKFDRDIKNLKGILRVVERLALHYTDFEIEIIGDGEPSFVLDILKEYSVLTPFVQFTGILPNEALPIKYAAADCFVLFSHFETFGMVLVESILVGTPVIAPRVGGIVDFVNSTNGILVSPDNEQDLYLAMERFIKKEIVFEPITVRKSIENIMSEQQVGNAYSQIYRALSLNR